MRKLKSEKIEITSRQKNILRELLNNRLAFKKDCLENLKNKEFIYFINDEIDNYKSSYSNLEKAITELEGIAKKF